MSRKTVKIKKKAVLMAVLFLVFVIVVTMTMMFSIFNENMAINS